MTQEHLPQILGHESINYMNIKTYEIIYSSEFCLSTIKNIYLRVGTVCVAARPSTAVLPRMFDRTIAA